MDRSLVIEEFRVANLRVRVGYDQWADEHSCPRNDDGNVGTLLTVHSRSTLGGTDDLNHSTMPELNVPCLACEGDGYMRNEDTCERCMGAGEYEVEPDEWARIEHAARVVLPVYCYEHGGITISCGAFSCPWDSGQVGIIFCTPNSLRAAGLKGASDERIIETLKAEVEVQAWYLEGRVYAWEIVSVDAEGEPDGEVDESCGGYLAEHVEEAVADARSEAEAHAKQPA